MTLLLCLKCLDARFQQTWQHSATVVVDVLLLVIIIATSSRLLLPNNFDQLFETCSSLSKFLSALLSSPTRHRQSFHPTRLSPFHTKHHHPSTHPSLILHSQPRIMVMEQRRISRHHALERRQALSGVTGGLTNANNAAS